MFRRTDVLVEMTGNRKKNRQEVICPTEKTKVQTQQNSQNFTSNQL